jgi:hypothetical protein
MHRSLGIATPVAIALLLALSAPAAAQETGATGGGPPGAATLNAEDRYVGYYYPPPQTVERYGPRVETLAKADQRSRVAFVTGLSNQMLRNQFAPPFMIFSKGDGNRHLIMVGLDDAGFATIYRLRAWLAGMTAMARATPIFSELGAPAADLTFLDLLKLLGFDALVVSDGRSLAHRILLL